MVGNNALHVTCREGHRNAVEVLLSESNINAEAVNVRGHTPMHLLAKYSRDNSAAICELYMEFIPSYPLDKPDAEGNTGKFVDTIEYFGKSNDLILYTRFSP